jgi:hypothetical protein
VRWIQRACGRRAAAGSSLTSCRRFLVPLPHFRGGEGPQSRSSQTQLKAAQAAQKKLSQTCEAGRRRCLPYRTTVLFHSNRVERLEVASLPTEGQKSVTVGRCPPH